MHLYDSVEKVEDFAFLHAAEIVYGTSGCILCAAAMMC